MRTIRVYADTSVFGGVFDREFRTASLAFFDQVKRRQISLFSSAIVREEISFSPKAVRELFASVLENAEIIEITKSALDLRDAYLKAKIIPRKYANDALHVAAASVSGCPIIVSWNFKHIVHFDKIALYNSINILEGFPQISIHSPLEVISYEKRL